MTDLFSFLVLFSTSIISLCAVIFVFYITIIGHMKGAPFAKSNKSEIKTMVDLAAIKDNELIVDLGSGDGSILLEAAKRKVRAIGIEINPFLVWYCRLRIKLSGLDNRVDIKFGDFRDFPLRNADVVFIYLLPETVKNLTGKFKKELKAGARVVSKGITLKGWKRKKKKNNIFLYRKI